MSMMRKSPPPLPVHSLHELVVLTSACLLKRFNLTIHLPFSSIIILFPLPLWKCYKFHYRRPVSPCLLTSTRVSNVQLLPTGTTSRNLLYTHLMTSGVYFKSRLWTMEETQQIKRSSWCFGRSSSLFFFFTSFLRLYCFTVQLNGLCFEFCISSGYLHNRSHHAADFFFFQ